MALHRLGRHDEAARAYEEARKIHDRLAATPGRQAHGSWLGVIHATLAEAEAKKLLDSDRK
jgi:hypothetical protein